MNLFIFNFNKTLGFFISLFTIYNICIVVSKPNITMLQNQQQTNYSFAQDFIYENNATNIIVGSSMAARIKNDFLQDDYYNLSFSGGSVLTGLEIIKRSGFLPKIIYIENNVIFRKKDEKLLESLFFPILWQVKQYIPALKEKYQPLSIVASKMKGSYGKSHEESMKQIRDENIYKINIKRHIIEYNKNLDNYKYKLDNLKDLIQYFENKSVKVVFFEMPIDNSLVNSVKAKEQRNIIKKKFDNQWLELPDNDKYITSDGIHLMYKSAYAFSEEFLKKVDKL